MKPQQPHTLPDGWEIKRLEELATINPTRVAKLEELDEVTFLGMTDVSDEGKMVSPHVKTYRDVKSGFTRFSNNDVLVAKINPCFENGKGALVQNLRNGIGFGSTEFHVIRIDAQADDRFIFYHTVTHEFRQRGKQQMSGSAGQQRVPSEFLRGYKVALPPLPEQRQIAAVLGTWDRAIEQTTDLLRTLRTRHRGLMHRLLTGQVRLPGYVGEWRHLELSDVFDRVNRRNSEGNTNVLTISAQQGLVSQGRYFNKNIASEVVTNYFLLRRGEFAYNKSYSAGYPMGAIKRLDQYDKGILSPLYICFRLRDNSEHEAAFFTHYFEGGCLNQAISEIAQEGARNHGLLNVGVGDFFAVRLIIPPAVAEQRAIADVLDASLREIRQHEAKLEALREQKRGLMQCLLTGQVRVPVTA